jgi:hypothetical protein
MCIESSLRLIVFFKGRGKGDGLKSSTRRDCGEVDFKRGRRKWG